MFPNPDYRVSCVSLWISTFLQLLKGGDTNLQEEQKESQAKHDFPCALECGAGLPGPIIISVLTLSWLWDLGHDTHSFKVSAILLISEDSKGNSHVTIRVR